MIRFFDLLKLERRILFKGGAREGEGSGRMVGRGIG